MSALSFFRRKHAQWSEGVVQATFDPVGPDAMRLHLIPPAPTLFGNPSSILMINGWHTLPIGPSWAALLRTFMTVLQERANPGVEITEVEKEEILDEVVGRMHALFPGESAETFHKSLDELLAVIYSVANGNAPSGLMDDVQANRYPWRCPQRMDLIVSPMTLGPNATWLCPLHCKNCYAAGQEAMAVEEELSTDDWEKIIDRCWQVGIPQVTFTGGEPTMRDDLPELVAHASQMITRLNTSGVTMTPALAQTLAEANLDAMQVTFYSHEAAIHDRLVGYEGAWQLTVAGIRNAIEAGINVSINTPLIQANADGYSQTLQFAYNLGVRDASCSGLIPTGAAVAHIDRGEALSNDEMYRVVRDAVSTATSLGMDILFTSPGWLSPGQLKSIGLTYPVCGACQSNMAVLPNGNVVPCQSWLKDDRGLGNMLTTPWWMIWNHPSSLLIRWRSTNREDCPLGGM